MATQDQAPPDAAEAPGETAILGQSWWQRYSPHGEFLWSWGISITLHGFLIVLLIVLARPFFMQERLPPAVDSVELAGDDLGGGEPGEGSPRGDLEAKAAPDEPPDPAMSSPAEVAELEKPTVEPAPEIPVIRPDPTQDDKLAEEAARRISEAREVLSRRFAQPGGAAGKPGPGTGGTGGQGGGTGSGRGGRTARWVLKFKTRSAQDYLAQLEGLGATLAFQLRGEKWRFFDRPSSQQDRWHDRELADDNRLYWIDENRQAVDSVAEVLRLPPAPFMVAFLPLELEARMAELEKNYQGRQEDEIRSTIFEVIRRGGKYDVMVIKQTLK
jgi:hypothetical protein